MSNYLQNKGSVILSKMYQNWMLRLDETEMIKPMIESVFFPLPTEPHLNAC